MIPSENLDLILGCDANAYHTIWDSTDTNDREENLVQQNIGFLLSIYYRISRRKVLDLTISIGRRIGFKGNEFDEQSMSDHTQIKFQQ